MKKIFILLLFILSSCDNYSHFYFQYYDSNTDEEKAFIEATAMKFNQLVGCKVIHLQNIEKNQIAKAENQKSEIQFLDRDIYDEIKDKYAINLKNLVTEGMFLGEEKDVFFTRDSFTQECFYKVDSKCIYTRTEITFFHEIGHVFGLEHTDNESDIMYKINKRNRSFIDFVKFVNDLKSKTNICKGEQNE